jgi:hypothetical protein
MAWLKHDRGLNTNLDNLYNTIKQVLEDEKNLVISQEFNGTFKIPLYTFYWYTHEENA